MSVVRIITILYLIIAVILNCMTIVEKSSQDKSALSETLAVVFGSTMIFLLMP